jgi:hypothetical protein
MRKFLLLTAAALVVGLTAAKSASCTTYEDTFSVTVNAGPWDIGTPTFTGIFTWDSDAPGSLLSFTSDLPSWHPGEQLGVVWLVDPPNSTQGYMPWEITFDPPQGSSAYSFVLYGIESNPGSLIYGTKGGETWKIKDASFVDPPIPTPEPGTFWLMATGMAGILLGIRHKRIASAAAGIGEEIRISK